MNITANTSSSSKERSFANKYPQLIKINEIFYSIQGESTSAGKPTVFVRLATCNLRCRYCDTRYAFWEGTAWSVDKILDEVATYPTKWVCLTGGEPLGQRNIYPLMHELLARGYRVSLETGGGFSVKDVPPAVVKVLDLKCPESGESEAMVWGNTELLTPHDQVKFVVSSKADFDWSAKIAREKGLFEKATVLVSPVADKVTPKDLAEWTLASGLPFTLQIQLHKVIWGNQRGV